VTLKRPKLRGTTEQFASRLLGKGVTRTNALESRSSPASSGGCRWATWKRPSEALGPEATESKSSVSRVSAVSDRSR
jgi:putative transposase